MSKYAPKVSPRPVSRDDMRKKGMTKKTTNNLTAVQRGNNEAKLRGQGEIAEAKRQNARAIDEAISSVLR